MSKAKKSRKGSKKSRGHKKSRKVKKGGGDCTLKQSGGVVLPSEYFGVDSGRYSSNPKSCQNSTSRGVVSADGKWAGTNMRPQHAGGKKKMNKRKHTKKANKKRKTRKAKKAKKSKKSKSRKH